MPFTSIDRAIDILGMFNIRNQELSALEISKQLGIPLSTTYKYLDTLLKKGFFSKDPSTKKYSLGISIFKMGIVAAEKISFIDITQPHISSLAEKCGETVILTVINGWEALCVKEIESPRLVKLTVKQWATIPLYAGASSKILLAYQNDSFIDDLIKNTGLKPVNENTITDPVKLKKELASIRDKGFATSESEVDSGAGAIAAPIFDHKRKLVAGITIAGPDERLFNEDSQKLIDMVKETADKISFDMGYSRDVINAPPLLDLQ
jgi:DNA-binding IclR family transcriptional regulator